MSIEHTDTYEHIKALINAEIPWPYAEEYLSLLDAVAHESEDEGDLMVRFEYVIIDIKANALVVQKGLHYIMEEYTPA